MGESARNFGFWLDITTVEEGKSGHGRNGKGQPAEGVWVAFPGPTNLDSYVSPFKYTFTPASIPGSRVI